MKQKLFIFLLAVLTGTGTLFAASGTCGDNLTWDLTNGTLTISGTGAMTNYSDSESNRAPWYSSRSSITSVVINAGVTSIGNSAFYGCSSLTSVEIPNSVTSIGGNAFSDCSRLTSVTIGNSVTSIGEAAFSYCSSLTSVTIPNSVTSIGNSAFYGCSSLTSVEIPNSVTSIGGNAFSDCSRLTSVTIGNSVTSIGEAAFSYCSSLTSVTIPNSVTSIGKYAFVYCSSLTSVTIPNSVTSIGDNAFYQCSSLTSVTNYATTPQTIASNVFRNVDQSACTLNVPAESVAAYQEADVWKDFGTIQAIEGITTSAPEVYATPSTPAQKQIKNGNVYILSGEKTYTVTGQEVR